MSISIVLAIILSSLAVVGEDSDSLSAYGTPSQQITYRYSEDTSSYSPVTVDYYGIAATEYNPEKWKGTGEISSSTANWVGPLIDLSGNSDYSSMGTGDATITFAKANTGTTYTVKLPSNFSGIQVGNLVNIATLSGVGEPSEGFYPVTGNSFKFTCSVKDANTQVEIRANYDLKVNMVFGGWLKSAGTANEQLVLPGDTVEDDDGNPATPLVLTAKWIVPDIFKLNKDQVDCSADSTFEVNLVSPYAILGNIYGDTKVQLIGEYTVGSDHFSNTGNYDDGHGKVNVVRGDKRNGADMFGTKYLLLKDRSKNGEGIFYLNVEDVTNNSYLKRFPAGTYTSTTDGNRITAVINSSKTSGMAGLIGNAVFDTMTLTTGGDPGKQGDGPNCGFFANGYALIMGAGLDNSNISSSYRGAPQIYGGSRAASISESVNGFGPKSIVFGDGNDHNLSVKLGTMIIVHSGIYRNLIAGGYYSCDIGTDSPGGYLSTYLVVKGGTVIDTVSGGNTGNNGVSQIYGGPGLVGNETAANPDVGGTFVYILGGFLSGDDWEDKEFIDSGQYGRDKFSSVFSSILQGGNGQGKGLGQQSKVQGSTHVFLSGKSLTWDVQGGGRSAYTHADNSYVEVSGNAVVRHVACGTITDGTTNSNNCVDHTLLRVLGSATVANLFGAGFDTYTEPSGRSMTGGTIQVEVLGGMVGDVFGGGYRGSVGATSDYHALKVYVTVSGGEIIGNVYGGGSGGLDKMKHTPSGDRDSSYGGGTGNKYSMGNSIVYGDVTVSVTGGIVHGNVYGGGMSVPKLVSYKGYTFSSSENSGVASVYGTVTVNVSGADTLIEGSVYGGGRGIELKETSTGWTPNRTPVVKVANISGLGTGNAFKDMYWVVTTSASDYTYADSEKYIKVKSATDHTIVDGDYLVSAKVYGPTTVIVTDSPTISGSVYGGGALGQVDGRTTVVMKDATVAGSVYGGGYGRVGVQAVSGERGVFIDGATIANSVYGGSSDGFDGPGTELPTGYKRTDAQPAGYKNSTVVVTSADITGSIFGGGSMGKTYGSTFVYIGWGYSQNEDGTYLPDRDNIGTGTKTISVDSVYAGGNIDPGNGEVADPFTSNLVQGHGLVEIYGLRVAITITGSVMGSGNSCNTALSTSINMVYFRDLATMAAVHRADSFSMYTSIIRLAGRNALNPNKVCSIFDIGEMTMQYDSELTIDNPADQVRSLSSLNRDGNPTTVSSPSNKIMFTSGSTFYIRPGTDELYGVMNGYAAISVDVAGGYGAYVLGSRNSPGGFVTLSNGTYRDANISDSANYTRCWYISGTENKVATMQLTTSGSGLITDTADVALTKLTADSNVKYNGGSFISMTADPGTQNPFQFDDPTGWTDSTQLATNQLGLTFGNGVNDNWFGGEVGTEMPGPAGDHVLTLTLKGKPYQNASIYLGYVVLDFDEVLTTSLGTENEQKIIINSISLRIDMYIVPQQMVADNDYDVLLMTDRTLEGNIVNINGYAEILVPKGFTMGALKLVKVTTENTGENPISITAVINHDNTTGWSSTVGTVKWSSSDDNDKEIGIMSGSVIATIRYSVDHFVYPNDSTLVPKFKLEFSTTVPGGEPITTKVNVTVKEKEPCTVTFVDSKSPVPSKEVQFGYGTEVSVSMCPTPEGANFIGWYTDPGFNNPYDHKRPLTEDITLYARYVYVVTLDNMDGTTSKIYAPEQSGGTRLGTLPVLFRGYEYEFGGWYKDSALVTKWNPNLDTVTGNTTLYAKWTGVSMTIEFYLSDGTTVFSGPNEAQSYDGKYILGMATEIDGDHTVTVPIYPTVSYGATFGTMDETQHKNILDVAKAWAETQYAGLYVSWQIYGTTTPVYADTVLTPSLVSLGPNSAHVIRLVAVTSNIAISLDMTTGVEDASATVSPPSTFLVQPDGIVVKNNRYYDLFGNEYTKTTEPSGRDRFDPVDPEGLVIYYYDGNGGYYMHQNPAVMDQFEEIVEDVEYIRYLDIYGNVWSKNGNGYVFVRCTVYTGVEETLHVVNSGEDFPYGSYYMDVFGNHYTRDQSGTPSRADTYTCTLGSPYSYMFSYTLNDATRSGYNLLGWHNTRVDPTHEQEPRAGTLRTLMLFVTPNYENTGNTVVKKEFINILGSGALADMYMTVDYDEVGDYPVLNDRSNPYKVTYVAKWNRLAYTVTVTEPVGGSINAFLTTTPAGGSETTILIDERYSSAHYGDSITLTYTPSEHYSFERWIVTGECVIANETDSTTTLLVHGNCSISVSEVGDRVLRLEMVFDNNSREETTDADITKTSVYVKDKDTGEVFQVPLISLTTERPAIYSEYIPLGTYEVHVLYEFSADNIVDCKMVGDAKVTLDGSTDYRYILISARIKASQDIEEGGQTVTYVTRGEQYVITYTKYVGALDSMVFGKPEDLIINNKDSGLPPVEMTIKPGCKYLAFEGFPDGGKFILNRDVNYFEGATTVTTTIEFNLNWTKYDKPADIIVQIDPDGYTVNYSNFDGTITGTLDTTFYYDGAPFGLPALTQAMMQKPGMEGKNIVDWYFDTNRIHKVVIDSKIDASTIGYVDEYKVITLYADITESPVVRVNIQIFAEESTEPMTTTPMFPLVLNDGNYKGTFILRHVDGHGTPSKMDPVGIASDKVTQTITTGVAVDTMGISIASTDWPGGNIYLRVNYPQNSATLSLDVDQQDVESGAWDGSKNAKYGDKVELPVMKLRDGKYAITGWSSTSTGTATLENGKYYYTMGATETGPVTLTPVYPAEQVTVTFATPIGSIEGTDGKQSVSFTVDKGSNVTVPSLAEGYDTNYTFHGFTIGNDTYDPNDDYEANASGTLTASFTSGLLSLSYSHDEHLGVSVSAGANVVPIAGANIHYGTVITVVVTPQNGYDLDLDATGSAGSSMGTPSISGDTYTYNFKLTAATTITIKEKSKTADISFIVNGAKVDDFNAYSLDGATTYVGGSGIPINATVKFYRYGTGSDSFGWYSDPVMAGADLLPSVTEDNKETYYYTVKENVSVYTTSGRYVMEYISYDGQMVQETLEKDAYNHITLKGSMAEMIYPGLVLVGWGVDGNEGIDYTYKLSQTIEVSDATPSRIILRAYYLTTGDITVSYTGGDFYSTPAKTDDEADPEMTLHYSVTEMSADPAADNYYAKKRDNDMYVYPTYPEAIVFSDPGVHGVYYYGNIGTGASQELIHGYFEITIHGDCTIEFYDGTTLVETRELIGDEAVGQLPAPTKSGYTLVGWFLEDGTMLTETMTAVELGHEVTAYARWQQSGGSSEDVIIIINPDGSITTKVTEREIEPDGTRVIRTKETTVWSGDDGTKTTEFVSKEERSDGTSRTESYAEVTDRKGEVLSFTMVIESVGPEGEVRETDAVVDDGELIIRANGFTEGDLYDVIRILELVPDAEVTVKAAESSTVTISSEWVVTMDACSGTLDLAMTDGMVSLDDETISNLATIGGDATLTLAKPSKEDLTERQRDIIGDSFCVSLGLACGDEAVSVLGGVATVSLNPGYNVDSAYYVADDGTVEAVPFAYDKATGVATMYLTHFSVYMLADEEPGPGPGPEPVPTEDGFPLALVAAGAVIAAIAAVAAFAILRKRRAKPLPAGATRRPGTSS